MHKSYSKGAVGLSYGALFLSFEGRVMDITRNVVPKSAIFVAKEAAQSC